MIASKAASLFLRRSIPTAAAAATRSNAGRTIGASGARMMSSDTVTFDLTGSFETYKLDTAPNDTIEMTKEELLEHFELMYTMRRMEITCDNEYKARAIRGFCHLYDGQEAVATGINAAFDPEDSWITSYRCHCTALARGGSVASVLGELFGNVDGQTQGKGGSMHFYNKAHNFFGGQGIVGAQVPVGLGLAFANHYNATPGKPMQVAIACYGDGAANQGQIWESANMASLWKLPMIFCIENNHYGMGTSIDRHSSHSDYYKMGNHIPGVRMDGMNVLAVKEGMRFVKDYVGQGNGPMYVEMMTYRYHGHSMSDPGTTYRNREEIALTRSTRDPLEFVKKTLIEAGFADAEQIKETEKRIRKEVAEQVKQAKSSSPPTIEPHLFQYVYSKDGGKEQNEFPPHVRMPDFAKSKWY
uniref:pyruvate dehydrogenase (acetyl-transferring) n=1 Tax=Skeletonema marinoi TaxID=267567 RepID=A0A7S1VWG5_9STRA|mmetsp:Transcript_29704/g.59716  ORF Transcript_29704/g.59716 Transcript_29704/m.59716 type:complete len:414 (+) Transcript_29704:263-1504(+)|eukprot:CAMPEP_0113426486 /NCGR_PEP_ID=MMETSP0013_2-20120614/30760_1 /TAXON_ID=2843 ORGANISM="Skeletonema costatum, Strain 1716" /NCGR_SAMPLE_ID=MMETSP0013_2 /ASSEMBLY_ACC=CAM_ASM_000158 /LENGTH=413 /DNA_ID=CAMNT_0000314781 /DNA_START=59 /DNA_END=1300 /DNA_ORIENTATION=+ /assembly_acc=CAM_ASM_000158